MNAARSGEVLFEYTRVGNTVRVTAVDATSGTEVTIQVPANLGQQDMQKAAMRKLEYVLSKKK